MPSPYDALLQAAPEPAQASSASPYDALLAAAPAPASSQYDQLLAAVKPPSPTPATDAAADPFQGTAPNFASPIEERVRAFAQNVGIPYTPEMVKEAGKFLIRNPIQDVKDIVAGAREIPGKLANFRETLAGSPAATVVRDPLSPEAFGVYGTAAGLLLPAAERVIRSGPSGVSRTPEVSGPAVAGQPVPETVPGSEVQGKPLSQEPPVTPAAVTPEAAQAQGTAETVGVQPDPTAAASEATMGTTEPATATPEAVKPIEQMSPEEYSAAVNTPNYWDSLYRYGPPQTKHPFFATDIMASDILGTEGEHTAVHGVKFDNPLVADSRYDASEKLLGENIYSGKKVQSGVSPEAKAVLEADNKLGDAAAAQGYDAIITPREVQVIDKSKLPPTEKVGFDEEQGYYTDPNGKPIYEGIGYERAKQRAQEEVANASSQPSAKSVPEPAVRAPVGQETPLRQPGETAPVQGDVGGGSTEPAPQEAVGISKAAIAEQRGARDLPDIERQKQIDFGTANDQANQIVANDPLAPTRLVDELAAKPRALNPEETPLLIRRVQETQAEFDRANKAVTDATTPEERTVAQDRLNTARAEYDKATEITQNATSKTGAGLNSLKMLLNEDYSLAKMESRRRAANAGQPLNPRQVRETADLHKRIAELEQKIQNVEKLQATRQTFAKTIREGVAEARAAGQTKRGLVDFLDEKAAKARERIISRRGRLNAGFDPTALTDEIIIGASHIAKGLDKFGTWSDRMITDFGERIRPVLKDIWTRAKAYHDQISRGFEKGGGKLSAYKKSLEKQIDKLQEQIDAEERNPARQPKIHTDEEVLSLIKQRNDLRAELEKVDPIYRRGLEKQISSLEKQIAEGKRAEPKQRKVYTQPRIIELMRKRDALRSEINRIDPIIRTEEQRLDIYKKSLSKRTKDLEERMATGNLTRPTRQELKLDREAFQMKANLQRLKNQFERAVANEAYKNKTPAQKFWDHFVGVERNVMKLSGPEVFGKLGMAAFVRETLAPVESGVGYGVSRMFPKLARGTKYGAGLGAVAKAEIRAKVQMFTKGITEAWENFKGRETELDAISGKHGRGPEFWYHRIGKFHAMIKAPVKRAEFERSLAQRMDSAIRNGEDVSQPQVMARLANEAVLDANRAIFQQNTVVSKVFSSIEKASPAAGRVARFLFPVVKIPTNIFKEFVGLHVGAPVAATRIGMAYWKGVETLAPLQREAIIRQLVKGSIGGAGLLWAYYNHDKVQAFFKAVPTWFQHTPMAMVMNEGSYLWDLQHGTKAEVKDATSELKYMAKSGIPFMYTVSDAVDALNAHDSTALLKWVNNMTQSTVVPQLSTQIAKNMDKPGTFPASMANRPTYRVARNPVEAVKLGIPGLRTTVPAHNLRTTSEKVPEMPKQRHSKVPSG